MIARSEPGSKLSRGAVTAIIGVVALFVLVLVLVRPGGAGPPVPGSRGPGGTLALRRFLHARGLTIGDAEGPPNGAEGTFVLFADFRTYDQDTAIMRWVEQGGRLVLADPRSDLSARLLVGTRGPIGGIRGTTTLAADCAAPETVAAGAIEVDSSDGGLTTEEPEARPCFGGSGGAFEIVRRLGNGTAVVLGGFSPFTNALLDKADNAAFAERILGASRPVVFGPPRIPGLPFARGREKGVWGSLPAAAKAALVAVAIAALFFVLVRGRRLGKPVIEEPLSPIPSGELVRATAKLYRKAGARAFAGDLLRTTAAAQAARRLGLPTTTSPEELLGVLARMTDVPEDDLSRVFAGPGPGDDDQLIALARELEEIRASLEAPAGAADRPH